MGGQSSLRRRDAFPLPPPFPDVCGTRGGLSSGTRRRILGTQHRQHWGNESAICLNQLVGLGDADTPLESGNAAQSRSLEFIKSSFLGIPSPDPSSTPNGAYEALLGPLQASCGLAQFGADSTIPWPDLGCQAVDLIGPWTRLTASCSIAILRAC